MPEAVLALVPAEPIAVVRQCQFARRRQCLAQTRLDLLAKPVDPQGLDGIFESRLLAIVPIAVVALHQHDRLRHGHDAIRRAVADDVGKPREGRRLTMRHAHAAPDADIESLEFACLDIGNEADVMGEDIDVVLRRDRQGDLELARQIMPRVQRLDLVFGFPGAARHAFFAEEDLVVGPGTRQQMRADLVREIVDLAMDRRAMGIGGADHVAIDVTAGSDGVHHGLVQCLQMPTQIFLEHAVILKGLARGDAQRAIGITPGVIVQRQPLLGGYATARQAQAHHERVQRLQLAVTTIVAQIAVILLIETMELGELGVSIADRPRGAIRQAFFEGAVQVVAVDLEPLVRMQLVERYVAQFGDDIHVGLPHLSRRRADSAFAAAGRAGTRQRPLHRDRLARG